MVVPEEELRVVPPPLTIHPTWFREVIRASWQTRVKSFLIWFLQYDMRVGQCIVSRLRHHPCKGRFH